MSKLPKILQPPKIWRYDFHGVWSSSFLLPRTQPHPPFLKLFQHIFFSRKKSSRPAFPPQMSLLQWETAEASCTVLLLPWPWSAAVLSSSAAISTQGLRLTLSKSLYILHFTLYTLKICVGMRTGNRFPKHRNPSHLISVDTQPRGSKEPIHFHQKMLWILWFLNKSSKIKRLAHRQKHSSVKWHG